MPLWLLTWISLKIFNLFIQKGDKLCSKLLFFVQKVLQYFSERKSIAIVQYFSFKKVLQYFCNTRKKYCNIALQYCNIAILRVWLCTYEGVGETSPLKNRIMCTYVGVGFCVALTNPQIKRVWPWITNCVGGSL